MKSKKSIKCDFLSFTGSVRAENQDGILINNDVKAYGKARFAGSIDYEVSDTWHLFALADGAGGTSCGYECSSILLDALNDKYNEVASAGFKNSLELSTRQAVKKASEEIAELLGDREGATTISLLWINPKRKRVFYFNMGDSPIWLCRKGRCCDVYEKHAEDNILKQFVGKVVEGNAHFGMMKMKKKDVFMIASDGIFVLNNDDRQRFMESTEDYDTLSEQIMNLICKDNVSFLKIRLI